MSSRSRCVAGTIARSTEVATKLSGGGAPGLIQPQQLARCGFKRTRWLEGKWTPPSDAVSDLEAKILHDP
jgi:hypothetical protein